MSEYLGFTPTNEKDYFFLSYNNDDSKRVGDIAAALAAHIPIWYDYGIPYGEKWEEEISVKISDSRAVLLFFTRSILFKEESWVIKEFRISNRMNKKIYVIMLDQIADSEVPAKRQSYWDDVLQLQNIVVYRADPEQTVDIILKAVSEKIGIVRESEPAEVPSEPAEDTLEPEVELHIVSVNRSRGFRRGLSKSELQAIRRENKDQLSKVRDQLQMIIAKSQPDAAEAYRCARTAMILVTRQLGAYDFEYKLEQKIEDFEKAYERNLTEIKQSILSGKKKLSSRGVILAKQVLLGLNEIIDIL